MNTFECPLPSSIFLDRGSELTGSKVEDRLSSLGIQLTPPNKASHRSLNDNSTLRGPDDSDLSDNEGPAAGKN